MAPTRILPGQWVVQPRTENACQVTSTGRTESSNASIKPYTIPLQSRSNARGSPSARADVGCARILLTTNAPTSTAPTTPHTQLWRKSFASDNLLQRRKVYRNRLANATYGIRYKLRGSWSRP